MVLNVLPIVKLVRIVYALTRRSNAFCEPSYVHNVMEETDYNGSTAGHSVSIHPPTP